DAPRIEPVLDRLRLTGHFLGGPGIGIGNRLTGGPGIEEPGQHPAEDGLSRGRTRGRTTVVTGDRSIDGVTDRGHLILTGTSRRQSGGRGGCREQRDGPAQIWQSHRSVPLVVSAASVVYPWDVRRARARRNRRRAPPAVPGRPLPWGAGGAPARHPAAPGRPAGRAPSWCARRPDPSVP